MKHLKLCTDGRPQGCATEIVVGVSSNAEATRTFVEGDIISMVSIKSPILLVETNLKAAEFLAETKEGLVDLSHMEKTSYADIHMFNHRSTPLSAPEIDGAADDSEAPVVAVARPASWKRARAVVAVGLPSQLWKVYRFLDELILAADASCTEGSTERIDLCLYLDAEFDTGLELFTDWCIRRGHESPDWPSSERIDLLRAIETSKYCSAEVTEAEVREKHLTYAVKFVGVGVGGKKVTVHVGPQKVVEFALFEAVTRGHDFHTAKATIKGAIPRNVRLAQFGRSEKDGPWRIRRWLSTYHMAAGFAQCFHKYAEEPFDWATAPRAVELAKLATWKKSPVLPVMCATRGLSLAFLKNVSVSGVHAADLPADGVACERFMDNVVSAFEDAVGKESGDATASTELDVYIASDDDDDAESRLEAFRKWCLKKDYQMPEEFLAHSFAH